MCEILIDVLVSAASALIWCVLIAFCCMCIEHLFFKKQIRPRLTDKEVILIKEVLAGHISLPLVANDGLFVECVDRIEHIFERFITRSRQQVEQLENLSEKVSAIQTENAPVDLTYPLHEENVFESENEERFSTLSFEEMQNALEMTKKNQAKEELLASSTRL
ncbi:MULTISPECIES: hypothetical protein [Dysgonomonas]|uniref:hypothetical protein n=1 Tax=Dysgonomonas TaxID=156973 RepID=UPI00092A7C8F|nr:MULTISPECIES: hypothetical protein [Dysgonomonas]MBN9302536.1 hypothetical protein [Dysgonomonas mossii]OJX59483.1 MAG: hypothetical protein BGO84_12080 [Dysgonomonas sp. 37-18]